MVASPQPPRRARVRGLRVDENITGAGWAFSPSMGFMAAKVDKLGLDIRSFREPLRRAIKQVMIPSFRANFVEGGRPDSWAPLSDYALARHAEEGGSGQPLIKSGALMRTMGQINVWKITPNAASIQDLPQKVWYGKVQQAGYGAFNARIKKHGGNAKAALIELNDEIRTGGARAHTKTSIPPRPFVVMQEDDYDGVEQVFQDWLQERIDKHWGGL